MAVCPVTEPVGGPPITSERSSGSLHRHGAFNPIVERPVSGRFLSSPAGPAIAADHRTGAERRRQPLPPPILPFVRGRRVLPATLRVPGPIGLGYPQNWITTWNLPPGPAAPASARTLRLDLWLQPQREPPRRQGSGREQPSLQPRRASGPRPCGSTFCADAQSGPNGAPFPTFNHHSDVCPR